MKNKLVLTISFFYLLLSLPGQSSQQLTPWFTVKEIFPKVWVIDDHKAVNMYLVEGLDSSLLVDTGMGVADLVSQIKKLTGKPLTVVNTHGHPEPYRMKLSVQKNICSFF